MRLDQARRIMQWLAAWWSVCIGTACSLTICAAPGEARAQEIPRAALQHRLALKREAQRVWGLEAPVATFAAQIHQESRWRPDARSPVGALGLAQFMPATARWIGGLDGGLAARAPLNPTWSIRALVVYDDWLWKRLSADTACDRMAFVLASYNSGLGTVLKKRTATGCSPASCRWFGQAERSPAGQSPENHAETTGYAQRILWQHEPLYLRAQWGRGSCS